MSRLFIFLNIFFILVATTTSLASKPKPRPNQKPHTFVFPVLNEPKSGLYYTRVTIGEPPLKVNLGVDLTGSALWFYCSEVGYKSTTSTPILCGSSKCNKTGSRCTTCSGSFGPFCRNDTCSAYLYNTDNTGLFEDKVILSYTSPSAYVVVPKLSTRLPLVCMPNTVAVGGFPYDSQGLIGLGNSSKSFVNRLVSSYKIPFKVALCLPSNSKKKDSGLLYVGGGPYFLPPNRKDFSNLLVSTPLVWLPNRDMGDFYYIDVKHIEVNGKKLSSDQNTLIKPGRATISTGIPYTTLESSIYKAFVKAFAGNAKKRKAVYPFDDCFSPESFARKKTPVISLVLGGGVTWKIHEANSLVKVNKNLVCLAFVKRVPNWAFEIEIGGYQMQDHLVEVDLQALKFSLTSSLLLHNTSCSSRL